MVNLLDENYTIVIRPTIVSTGYIKGFKGILAGSDWMIIRHQEEVLAGEQPTLSDSEFSILRANRQKLRNKINELEV